MPKKEIKHVDIAQELLAQRIIYLGSEIDACVANNIIAQLLYLDSVSDADISMYINSPGGVVNDGLAIVDTMNLIRSDVSTICAGMAASMGSIILMSGEKGKRHILPNSSVLIHQPLGGVSGQATDIEIHAREILRMKDKLTDIIVERTDMDRETIANDIERDKYLTAEEALKYGIVDTILGKKE